MIQNWGNKLLPVSGDTYYWRDLILNKLSKASLACTLTDEESAVSCDALLVQSLARGAEKNEIWRSMQYIFYIAWCGRKADKKRNKYFWDDDGTEHLADLSLPSRCKLRQQNVTGRSNMLI